MGRFHERQGPMAAKKKARKKSSKKRAKKPHLMKARKGSKFRSNRGAAPCKPAKKARRKKASKRAEPTVTAAKLLSRAKRYKSRKWACMGPVRNGCGGSNSKVVG